MTKTEAKKIGSRQGRISAGIGILIAQLIITLFLGTNEGFVEGFFWFVRFGYSLNIAVGILFMLACGHFYGQLAGKLILINKWDYISTGDIIGIALVVTAAFLTSWIGFIQEGFRYIDTEHNPFIDYIIRPTLLITAYGLTPTLIVGIWFGRSIKRKGHITQNSV